jgi:hypothetical protein
MNYNSYQASIIYMAGGFRRRFGKLVPSPMMAHYIFENYEKTDRDFSLTDDELYDGIDTVIKTLHTNPKTSFAQDYMHTFSDKREMFLLKQLQEYMLKRWPVSGIIRLMERK